MHPCCVTAPREASRRRGTLFVLEEQPPTTRLRWYCHGDVENAPGFDSVEEAVIWGLERASGVVVRTVDFVYYVAGRRPSDWGADLDLRSWPPERAERDLIDRRYVAAIDAAMAGEAAWPGYN
jgi:hypothetical protein